MYLMYLHFRVRGEKSMANKWYVNFLIFGSISIDEKGLLITIGTFV